MKKMVRKTMAILMAAAMLSATTVYAAEDANIASQATVTVSTEFNADNAGKNAVDGQPIQHGLGEWASQGEVKPWIKLEWSKPVVIQKIVVYDRPNTLDNANGGTITFSDGSTVDVFDVDPEGKAAEVTFDAKTVTSLQFDINGAGSNVGLCEIEVFGHEEGAAAEATPADTAENTAGTEEKSNDNPKTGDISSAMYILLAGISGAGFMVGSKKKA